MSVFCSLLHCNYGNEYCGNALKIRLTVQTEIIISTNKYFIENTTKVQFLLKAYMPAEAVPFCAFMSLKGECKDAETGRI